MSEHVQNLMAAMREANATAKTARARIKTSADLTARGDLLARTIHQITEQAEELAFPEEVRLRKEAAEREQAAETPAETPAETTAETAAETPAGTPAETPAEDSGETAEAKEAAVRLSVVENLIKHPLFKQGFDQVLEENEAVVRQSAYAIMAGMADRA